MDTYQRQDDDVPNSHSLNVEHILKDIQSLVNQKGSKAELNAYLDTVQKQVHSLKRKTVTEANKRHIKHLVERHPYFKNPCNYHIRLITIMKYLKRKGIDVTIEDIDLLIDDIIASIDGVVRLEYGRYYRKRA